MEKKQNSWLKFVHVSLLILPLLATPLYGQEPRSLLERSDSLFLAGQYTQSFALYKELFDQHTYSPAMLLKMAFIQEGLKKKSQSLYYLNLYYLISGDDRVLDKIHAMIKENDFQGYDFNPFLQFRYALQRNYIAISVVLVVVMLLICALLLYQQQLRKFSHGVNISLILLAGLLFAHTRFSHNIHKGIVTAPLAYLMDGASAGSSVIGRIGEGNQVAVSGSEDVWLRVKWLDQVGYVKKDKISRIGFGLH